MQKHLRKIRKEKISNNNYFGYTSFAILEVVLIVVGIFLAIQLDNANNQSKAKNDVEVLLKEIMKNLSVDIQQSNRIFDRYISHNKISNIIFDDSTTILNICYLHESSEYSELVPFTDEYDLNSLGFRGAEFSEVKAPNTYRIFLVGGSTMIGSGATGEETTKSGILQKMFDSDNSVQNIEVINGAFFGANSATEFDLLSQKLVNYQPDLIILFDGLNDLKADYAVEYTKDFWKSTCQFGKQNNIDIICF